LEWGEVNPIKCSLSVEGSVSGAIEWHAELFSFRCQLIQALSIGTECLHHALFQIFCVLQGSKQIGGIRNPAGATNQLTRKGGSLKCILQCGKGLNLFRQGLSIGRRFNLSIQSADRRSDIGHLFFGLFKPELRLVRGRLGQVCRQSVHSDCQVLGSRGHFRSGTANPVNCCHKVFNRSGAIPDRFEGVIQCFQLFATEEQAIVPLVIIAARDCPKGGNLRKSGADIVQVERVEARATNLAFHIPNFATKRSKGVLQFSTRLTEHGFSGEVDDPTELFLLVLGHLNVLVVLLESIDAIVHSLTKPFNLVRSAVDVLIGEEGRTCDEGNTCSDGSSRADQRCNRSEGPKKQTCASSHSRDPGGSADGKANRPSRPEGEQQVSQRLNVVGDEDDSVCERP